MSQNKLQLTDSISKYLPQIIDHRVTIRDLLTHTSGVTGFIKNRDQLTQTQLTQALLGLTFGENFEKKVVYSDIGMVYLGWIIEKITGSSVQEVIQKNVLQPIGMSQSTFTPSQKHCVPTTYSNENGLLQGCVHDPKAAVLKEHCGSAGLFSTVEDLIKFCTVMLAQNDQLLSLRIKKVLLKDWTSFGGQRSLGWDLKTAEDDLSFKQPALFHSGFTGTFLLIDPWQQTSFVFLSNRIHPIAKNERFLVVRDQLVQLFLAESRSQSPTYFFENGCVKIENEYM